MNTCILIGRLTRDPELRYSSGQNQTAVCRFNLAVDRANKRDGEDAADFFRIVAFGSRGEFAGKYFKKGQRVAVRGRIQTSKYQDNNGQMVRTFDIIADEVDFADGKPAPQQPQQQPQQQSSQQPSQQPPRQRPNQQQPQPQDYQYAQEPIPAEWADWYGPYQ